MRTAGWIHATGGALVGGAIVLWLATGREGFTRWPDARLENAGSRPSAEETALLADAGLSTPEETAAHEGMTSRFAFGLLPGGPGVRHLASVATACAIAGVCSGVAYVGLSRKARDRGHRTSTP